MSNDFIEMINDIDFSYGFIYEHADLVNNLYDNYNYDLAIELYYNFVLPIINITKNDHIKDYNEHVENIKHIKNNCSYLMDICFERYFELSRNEYSKIKKFIDNNIDTFESILAPTNSFANLYIITHLIFLYWDVLITLLILIVIVQKIMVNVFVLLKEIVMF